jgi:hypothetical protein
MKRAAAGTSVEVAGSGKVFGALLAALAALPACSYVVDWDPLEPRASDAGRVSDAGLRDAACTGAGCGDPDAADLGAIGCADGEREGFVDAAAQPSIAGCAGGFALAGLRVPAAPACGGKGGDDGELPDGTGCNASDLCAAGWRVCLSSDDVASRAAGGTCAGLVPEGAGELFFATRQSGPGLSGCGEGADDLFGCGSLGASPHESCTPLDRYSGDLCASLLAPWSCGSVKTTEAESVTKTGPGAGGVLCCRELAPSAAAAP